MGKLITAGERWLRRDRKKDKDGEEEAWQLGVVETKAGLVGKQGNASEDMAGKGMQGSVSGHNDVVSLRQERRRGSASGHNDVVSWRQERRRGVVLVVLVLGVVLVVSLAALWLVFLIHPVVAFVLCAVMCWLCLSVRCLAKEATKVKGFLDRGDLSGARTAVSMIVGRDVDALDEEGVAKAAIETVAENTADGVIAPMLYMAVGGPVLGMVYKAVNTLDSMVGYKNERYREFGRAAARLDDAVGLLPARLGALFMILACSFSGLDGPGALRIWRRDRRNHASPNSAQCESALAGALGVALAGDGSYFGQVVRKPVIGDAGRRITPADIKTSTRVLYGTSLLFLPAAFFISAGISMIFFTATGLTLWP